MGNQNSVLLESVLREKEKSLCVSQLEICDIQQAFFGLCINNDILEAAKLKKALKLLGLKAQLGESCDLDVFFRCFSAKRGESPPSAYSWRKIILAFYLLSKNSLKDKAVEYYRFFDQECTESLNAIQVTELFSELIDVVITYSFILGRIEIKDFHHYDDQVRAEKEALLKTINEHMFERDETTLDEVQFVEKFAAMCQNLNTALYQPSGIREGVMKFMNKTMVNKANFQTKVDLTKDGHTLDFLLVRAATPKLKKPPKKMWDDQEKPGSVSTIEHNHELNRYQSPSTPQTTAEDITRIINELANRGFQLQPTQQQYSRFQPPEQRSQKYQPPMRGMRSQIGVEAVRCESNQSQARSHTGTRNVGNGGGDSPQSVSRSQSGLEILKFEGSQARATQTIEEAEKSTQVTDQDLQLPVQKETTTA